MERVGEMLLADDLKTLDQRMDRHALLLGTDEQHEPISLLTLYLWSRGQILSMIKVKMRYKQL